MATKTTESVNLDDFDDLLNALSAEELEKVNDYVDPENSYLPASDRCKPQTFKAPTGPYDREKLLGFVAEQGKNEKDWEEQVPFVPNQKRGKVWKPPEVTKPESTGDDDDFLVTTEWDDALTNANEAEIVELAAILGFTGLINQVQYHAAVKDKNEPVNTGGWNAAAKGEALKIVPREPDNMTSIEDCIKKATANENDFNSINLNNIRELKSDVLEELLNALKENTHVEILQMANVGMTDNVGRVLAELIGVNKTLKTVNAESNRLTGPVITEIVRSTLKNQTLLELRLSNQRSQILGNRVEMEVADAIAQNNTILRLNLQFDTIGPRVRITEKLKQNFDALRKKRQMGNSETTKEPETPKKPETKETPKKPETKETPKKPETAKTAETPKKTETTKVAETAKKPETAKVTETTKKPETAKVTETPKKPETAKVAETPKKPETAKVAETVKKPETAKVAETPKKPETAKAVETPKVAETPKKPEAAKSRRW